MNIKTALIAALAGVFAVTAAAPSIAAQDPAKKEKRINRLIKRADLNGDGKISPSEMSRGIAVTFAKLDVNGDGKLSASEISNAKTVMKAERKRAKASGEGVQFVKFPAKRAAWPPCSTSRSTASRISHVQYSSCPTKTTQS